ncbi:MAG: NfeD family protein [Bacteriovoracaceae bacterium]|nr:NfeD family protein [Bacteriovoracaceae bacterium]
MKYSIIWLIVGVILTLSELIVPGGVVIFVGISSICVYLLLYFGFITSFTTSLIIWFILSIFLLFTLRSFFMKYFEGDTTIHNTNELEDMLGASATVLENIENGKGRIIFRGTTWQAICDIDLPKGSDVIIKDLKNNIFTVIKKEN